MTACAEPSSDRVGLGPALLWLPVLFLPCSKYRRTYKRKHWAALCFPIVLFPQKKNLTSKANPCQGRQPREQRHLLWPIVFLQLSSKHVSHNLLLLNPGSSWEISRVRQAQWLRVGEQHTPSPSIFTNCCTVLKTTLRSTYSNLNLTDVWRQSHKAFPQTQAADTWAGLWFGKFTVIWNLKKGVAVKMDIT